MSGSTIIHTDSDPLIRCTHQYGSGGMILKHKNQDFKSCGVIVGLAIYNDTDGSNGLVTEVTEDSVTCTLSGGTNNYWSYGDQASIYKTATKDSYISKNTVDRSRGWKVTSENELDKDGFLIGDGDKDRDDKEVWSSGFPERVR
jgi:hypothetical protein